MSTQDRVLLVDKPLRWTSFDAVKWIRGYFKLQKVGHAGTLDPLATGLLILCSGKKTKEIALFQALPKVYEATIVLGKTTPSYDLETPVEQVLPWEHLQLEEVTKTILSMQGPYLHVPPAYSAIKKGGRRAYAAARAGKPLTLAPREVTLHEIKITHMALPEVMIQVTCSKGTYIRTLAADIGQRLGVGAHLSALRRTQIGTYHVENAFSIEKLKKGKSFL